MGGKGKRKRRENTMDPPLLPWTDTSSLDDSNSIQEKKRKKDFVEPTIKSESNQTYSAFSSEPDLSSSLSSSSSFLSLPLSMSNSNSSSDSSSFSSTTPTSSSSSSSSSFGPMVSSTLDNASVLNSDDIPSQPLPSSQDSPSGSSSSSSSPSHIHKLRKSPKRIKMKSPLNIKMRINSLASKHPTPQDPNLVYASISTTVSSPAFTPSSSPSTSSPSPLVFSSSSSSLSSSSSSSFLSPNKELSPSPPSYDSSSSSSSSSSLSHSSLLNHMESSSIQSTTSMQSFIPSKLKFPIKAFHSNHFLSNENNSNKNGSTQNESVSSFSSSSSSSSSSSIQSIGSTEITTTTTTPSSLSLMPSIDSMQGSLSPSPSHTNASAPSFPVKDNVNKHKHKKKTTQKTKITSSASTVSPTSFITPTIEERNAMDKNEDQNQAHISSHMNFYLPTYFDHSGCVAWDKGSVSTLSTLSSGDFSSDPGMEHDQTHDYDYDHDHPHEHEPNAMRFNEPLEQRTPSFHFFNNSDLSMDVPSLKFADFQKENDEANELVSIHSKKIKAKKGHEKKSSLKTKKSSSKGSSVRRSYPFESGPSDTSHLIHRDGSPSKSLVFKKENQAVDDKEEEQLYKVLTHKGNEEERVIKQKSKQKSWEKNNMDSSKQQTYRIVARNGEKEEGKITLSKKRGRLSRVHTHGYAYDYDDENENEYQHAIQKYEEEEEEANEEDQENENEKIAVERKKRVYSNLSTPSYSNSFEPTSLSTATTSSAATTTHPSYTKLKLDFRSNLSPHLSKDHQTLLHHYELKSKDVECLQERIDGLSVQILDRDNTIAQLYRTIEELQTSNQNLSQQISGFELDRAQHAKPVGLFSLELNPVKLASLVQTFENGLDKFCRSLLVSSENKTRLRKDILQAMLQCLVPVQLRQHHMARFLSGYLYQSLVQCFKTQDPLLQLLQLQFHPLSSLFTFPPSSTTYLREWHLHASVPETRDPNVWTPFVESVVTHLHTTLTLIQFQVTSDQLIALTKLVHEFISLFHLTQAMESDFVFPCIGDRMDELIMTCDDTVELELHLLNDSLLSPPSPSSTPTHLYQLYQDHHQDRQRLMEWIGCTSSQDTHHHYPKENDETKSDQEKEASETNFTEKSIHETKHMESHWNPTSTAVLFSASPYLQTKDGLTVLSKASIFAIQRPSELDGLANVAFTMDPLPVPSHQGVNGSYLERQHAQSIEGHGEMQDTMNEEIQMHKEEEDDDDIILA